ncbi:MAG TPA: signal peptide peptidase SppA [Opitutaceae bacterium]|nr:signal peptide peptidase SppA [Opitutaceae bacterium]
MKNFLTSMLGALAALVIFAVGGTVLFLGVLGLIAALGQSDKSVALEHGAYVVYDLSANITDGPPAVSLGDFAGDRGKTLQLRTVTRALRAAAHDDRITGVFLKGSVLPVNYGSGYAALKEVRAALNEVRAAGKPIHAFLTNATTRDMYLASTATDLALDPYGMIVMPGLASEPIFFSGAFEKYGVGIQVTRVGKYKSFVEPFTRQDMSPENREQTQKLLDDLWGTLVADIAQSRGLTPAALQGVVDKEGIIRPDVARTAKLVDRTVYLDEVIADLKRQTGAASGKQTFKQIPLASYAKIARDAEPAPATAAKAKGHDQVALVYAEGDIVDGEGALDEVGGAKFARELRELRQDKDVKAVVLRVNSPGGSAPASETIQREIRLTRQVKPVIVSMGSYAASGGYWISTYGDWIFAEPSTITGSIGVFGIQFDVKKLANNFGVTFDSVKTGKFADAITISRPKTDEELAVFQRLVDWIYGEFITKVADSRKLKRDFVEEIAQGRVWSGAEAKKLGLVDEIGGLDAAVAYAAKKAGLGSNYELTEYPQKKDLIETITDWLDDLRNGDDARIPRGVVGQVMQRVKAELNFLKSFNEPSGLYARLPANLDLH